MKRSGLIHLVPLGNPEHFADLLMVIGDAASKTLRDLLSKAPALSTKPLDEAAMSTPLSELRIQIVAAKEETPLFRPPGLTCEAAPASTVDSVATEQASFTGETARAAAPKPEAAPSGRPKVLTDADAVKLAYWNEIKTVASFLRTPVSGQTGGLSVLVRCDKLVVEHLFKEMARQANLEAILLDVGEEKGDSLMPQSLRQREMTRLKELIKSLKVGHVLVVPHLDLLAGAADSNLSAEAREIVELLYEASDRLLLAFADRSLEIPEVLASRFAVRILLSGLPRVVTYPDGTEKSLGEALVTEEEAARFKDFDSEGLYKNVAGLNPVRFRHAIAYTVKELGGSEPRPVEDLYRAIRSFKAQTSANFEVPDVGFDQIGGYEEVKEAMRRVLNLMVGSVRLPNEKLRRELVPRGFIFHGPPGTGKTLFAKAIANSLNATIQVVSGPEVTDMYVGESERKVREIFAEARRNAPAVLVFDEFDAIATQRSGGPDGGSRAGNAIVAQILTEMDGFRPDVPVLVIGTTNRLDIIDEALLRPSRFQAIAIELPDHTARRAIAKVHARHFDVAVSDQLLDLVADATQNLNGDEIRSIFRDACVGLYCEEPPMAVDARRLGNLVGRIRHGIESREAEKTTRRGPQVRGGRHPTERPAASTRISLTPARNAPTPESASAPPSPAQGESNE
jgi:transitional endoplasmic reticulum ATPase